MKRIFTLLAIVSPIVAQAQKNKLINIDKFMTPDSTNYQLKKAPSVVDKTGIGTFAYVDVKYGFKDIKLESNIQELKKNIAFKRSDSSDYLVYYDVVDKRYFKVGTCTISKVFITCFKNKVLTIFIKTDAINSDCLLGTLKELYGRGFQPNEYIDRYIWIGKIGTVLFDENTIKKEAITSISSKEFDAKYAAFIKDSRKKNASDL